MHNSFEMVVRLLEVINDLEKRGKITISNELTKIMVDQSIMHYNVSAYIQPKTPQQTQQPKRESEKNKKSPIAKTEQSQKNKPDAEAK